jgi:cytidine deaminase
MEKQTLEAKDFELIEAAKRAVLGDFAHEWMHHTVGAALRMRSGAIITAVNLRTVVVDVCAERVALGKAMDTPNDKVETSVAVFSPCGVCREAVTDYAMDSHVILREPHTHIYFKVHAKDLLPYIGGMVNSVRK